MQRVVIRWCIALCICLSSGMLYLSGCGTCPTPGKEQVRADSGVPPERSRSVQETKVLQCSLKPLQPLTSEMLPRCSASTSACVRRCVGASESCFAACLYADKTPVGSLSGLDCSTCTLYDLMICAEKTSCKKTVDRYRCCAQTKCTGANASRCESLCQEELNALYACVGTVATPCFDSFYSASGGCFPERYNPALCKDIKAPKPPKLNAEPRCNAQTARCVRACDPADVTCQFKCLSADKTPAKEGIGCTLCVYNAYLACNAEKGCKKQVEMQLCCESQNCSNASDFAECSQTLCYEENLNSNTCASGSGSACVDAFIQATSSCFEKP